MPSGGGWILLVDDHDDGRELLSEFLTLSGFSVESRASGEDALACISTHGTPRVVVTDLTLGQMSGTDLARALRKDPATSKVPILAVTGHVGFEDPEHLFAAVMIKPVALGELKATVLSAMGP